MSLVCGRKPEHPEKPTGLESMQTPNRKTPAGSRFEPGSRSSSCAEECFVCLYFLLRHYSLTAGYYKPHCPSTIVICCHICPFLWKPALSQIQKHLIVCSNALWLSKVRTQLFTPTHMGQQSQKNRR